jgi:hypothetical protein
MPLRGHSPCLHAEVRYGTQAWQCHEFLRFAQDKASSFPAYRRQAFLAMTLFTEYAFVLAIYVL